MSTTTRRMRRSLALAIAAGALAAPAASAAPIDPEGVEAPYTVNSVEQGQGSEQSPTPSINAVLGSDGVSTPTSVLAAAPQTEADGFDWGDAGIGAAAMLAVGAIGAGAALATGRMSRQRDVPQSAS